MTVRIIPGNLDDPQVVALLSYHHKTCHEITPKGSAHALDLTGLKQAGVHFFAAWEDENLLGVGAYKLLDERHGEVKSMHTSQAARRKGIGSMILNHLKAEAKAAGVSRLSLETGSFEFFAPAVALYRAHGFVECEPFGDYKPDPNSLFMTLEI